MGKINCSQIFTALEGIICAFEIFVENNVPNTGAVEGVVRKLQNGVQIVLGVLSPKLGQLLAAVKGALADGDQTARVDQRNQLGAFGKGKVINGLLPALCGPAYCFFKAKP